LLQDVDATGFNKAVVWTPPVIGDSGSGTFVDTLLPDDLFCSGHAALADGTVLFAGGAAGDVIGIIDADIFDPVSLIWTEQASMAFPRWYPTSTTLPDGRVLVTAGNSSPGVRVETPEVYHLGTNTWQQLTSAKRSLPMYPWMFVLPSDGVTRDTRVFSAGSSGNTKVLNVTTGTWEPATYSTKWGNRGDYRGTAVTYGPGKVLIAGGRDPSGTATLHTNTAELIDLNQLSPEWQFTGSMKYPRGHLNSTLLPDGTVLVTGGTERAFSDPGAAVLAAELFDPVTGTWTEMASMQVPRLYHSTAFLLPDGRVVTTGTHYETRFEIYSPPYLFKGARPSASPIVPNNVKYGSAFNVEFTTPEGTSITKVALIRLSSVTHSFNMDQRYVPLSFTVSGSTLSVQAPVNSSLAPPGYYMLFIVNDQGVPSMAARVRLLW
jgi:hypothetical protein